MATSFYRISGLLLLMSSSLILLDTVGGVQLVYRTCPPWVQDCETYVAKGAAVNPRSEAAHKIQGRVDPDLNHDAFGLVVMDGPSELLASVAPESDWVIVGCTDDTRGIQGVLAYCRKHEDDPSSGCSAVFEGGAQNTIIKLPDGCGGPYARLHSLQINHSPALPTAHATQKPPANPVYTAQYDFDFGRMSETRSADNGTVSLHVEVNTMGHYLDADNVADPESLHDWAESFGSIERNEIEHGNAQAVLFSASETCTGLDGNADYTASMNLTASGMAQMDIQYGLYFQASIIPPKINQAYIYASANASATVNIDLYGKAEAKFSGARKPIISPISFPGYSITGIVSVTPTLNIYGEISGDLTASGHIGVSPTYTVPPASVTLGIVGGTNQGAGNRVAVGGQPTFSLNPSYDVTLEGSLSAHVIPVGILSFEVLPSTVDMKAAAYIQADGSVSVSFVPDQTGVEATISAEVDVTAGGNAGSSLNFGPYTLADLNYTLYQTHLNLPSSSPANVKRDSLLPEGPRVFAKRGLLDGIISCPKQTA